MILTIWKYKHIPLQSIQNMETIKNMVLWPMSWNFCHHMDLSSAGKTASSLWRRSTAFAKILLLWPTTSSFTWASAMRQRFWRPLHEAVFQDKTHTFLLFWRKMSLIFIKYLELALNCHSLAQFCDWTVYLRVL